MHGVDNFISGFRYGKCDRILYLQVVRRKRQWQLAQMKTPENGLSGVFACELHGYNFISGYRYCSICKNVFQYTKSEKQHKNFFTSYI